MSVLWYALRVKPRFEKLVHEHLERKGYEAFLPSYLSRNRWSDRVKQVRLPLFSGYTFCRFDVNARLPILITPGVQFIVGVGRSPVAVEPSEIETIRLAVNSGQPIRPWPFINVGQRVEIERGPLQGLCGIVLRVKNIDRLIISVSLLMRSVAVEIDHESVRPVNRVRPSEYSSVLSA
jgi:transcription termination/antitermination protein NusG